MKNLFFLLFSVFIFGQKIETITLNSKFLNQEREALVYLPSGYDEQSSEKYEVVYVFDAQAREYFDLVHSAINFYNERMFPMIVVGVISPTDESKFQSRNTDFLPKAEDPETSKNYGNFQGNVNNFMNFVTDELSGYIEKNYRTLPVRIGVGHSNGATFLSYAFLNKPDFFDAYILVSPNYEYDKARFVKDFKKFDFDKLKSKKFFYLSNADEAVSFSKEWGKAHLEVAKLLQQKANENKITYFNQDFSKTENHGTVFPVGASLGLKNYFDIYKNPKKIIARINANETIYSTPQKANNIAYISFYSGNVQDAIKILLWANQKFPEDLNLYDSIGEMYENAKDKVNAYKYYQLFEQKLEATKKQYKPEDYQQKKDWIKGRFENLKKIK